MSSRGGKLAPEVNRALFVKNLSYNVTPEELFDLFGKFGPIRQVRQGIASGTKGTAFVVYEDVMDAKQACDKLNGFNFQNRYLIGMSADHLQQLWIHTNLMTSSVSPAREDAQVKRGPRGSSGSFSAAQDTARYRLTIRRVCGTPPDTYLVCRPVYFFI
ncbi:uncharacterized protein BDZ83DRAFT_606064 [Colletotrichum acutatum]|uniref:RRM domain-containing protein n=1 Tax=Glomerella acutata TaxID=27357 RepID=A0AAD8XL19_GLOAC|nr:uncharacterized protein BDZ83DRAFT_606064 [Colletotrichum acutatum]KAK1729288.1 hypothetical protein BDZ83DRAFT_606064 [Colletotrichum acutatum]